MLHTIAGFLATVAQVYAAFYCALALEIYVATDRTPTSRRLVVLRSCVVGALWAVYAGVWWCTEHVVTLAIASSVGALLRPICTVIDARTTNRQRRR